MWDCYWLWYGLVPDHNYKTICCGATHEWCYSRNLAEFYNQFGLRQTSLLDYTMSYVEVFLYIFYAFVSCRSHHATGFALRKKCLIGKRHDYLRYHLMPLVVYHINLNTLIVCGWLRVVCILFSTNFTKYRTMGIWQIFQNGIY